MAKIDKELALAVNFEKAPDEVKKIAASTYQAFLRAQKAEAQLSAWSLELNDAGAIYNDLLREFRRAMASWDPAGVVNAKPEEKK